MGLLDAIYSGSDRIKRNVKGLLSDPLGYLEQVGGMLTDEGKAQSEANKRMIHDPLNAPQSDYSQTIGGLLNFAPLGMTVWHGSPHKFDKFDMSKIGTGEGAQAYGHGLYMADSPAVAKTYQDQLSKPTFIEKRTGRKISPQEQEWQDVLDRKFRMESNGYGEDFAKKYDMEVGGQLYKVDIPDEAVARFLDWDKPLSQQAPEVRDALLKQLPKDNVTVAYKNPYNIQKGNFWKVYRGDNFIDAKPTEDAAREYAATIMNDAMTGGSAYGRIGGIFSGLGSHSAASDYLKQQGIPGIRYLDGGSRSAGQGSSNFVLFSDELPRILETNGVPTGQVPWNPGEWGLLK